MHLVHLDEHLLATEDRLLRVSRQVDPLTFFLLSVRRRLESILSLVHLEEYFLAVDRLELGRHNDLILCVVALWRRLPPLFSVECDSANLLERRIVQHGRRLIDSDSWLLVLQIYLWHWAPSELVEGDKARSLFTGQVVLWIDDDLVALVVRVIEFFWTALVLAKVERRQMIFWKLWVEHQDITFLWPSIFVREGLLACLILIEVDLRHMLLRALRIVLASLGPPVVAIIDPLVDGLE